MKYLGQSFSTNVPRHHRWSSMDADAKCVDCGMTWKKFQVDPQCNKDCRVSKGEQKA